MISKRKILIYIIILVIIISVVFFIYTFNNKIIQISMPFFMALIIAYLMHPMVIRLEEKGISRTAGILSIYFVLIILAATAFVFLIPEVINNTRDLINTVPEITLKYQNDFSNIMNKVQSSNWSPEIKNAIYREVQNSAAVIQNMAVDTLKKSLLTLIDTVTAMFDLVLAMIIAYYFIKDADFFKESALSLIPRRWRNGIIGTGREINLILSNFIQGQLLTALIVGIMEIIGLSIVKVKYSIVLGLIGGLANIIPYFGPVIGAIPALAVALLESPGKALWTALVFTIVQQIDNSFISPKIIEGRLGLHPVTTILAVLVGGEFFGITGMLVSVPMLAMIKAIVKRSIEAIV